MRTSFRVLFLSLILVGSNSCIPNPFALRHSRDIAASKAILFAKEAFIDLNQPEAYSLLTEEMRRNVSLDKFIEVIAEMHPVTFPQVVTAMEYEPIRGQKAMFIWLYGENEKEKFYYRLMLEGTASTNYEVASMFRLNSFPPSEMRKSLATKRSTADLR